jgi:hypothetical protein
VLAFRGTDPSEMTDLITDLWSTQSTLAGTDAERIGTVSEESDRDGAGIYVHTGFWHALDIVWPAIEGRVKALLEAGKETEKAAKMTTLDRLAALFAAKEQAALTQELSKMTDWNLSVEAKRAFVKQWLADHDDPKRRESLFAFLQPRWASWQKPIFVAGHSLGGALATLATYRLLMLGANVRGLYTFGSPRVGNRAFSRDFRLLALNRGLKGPKREGGLARFVAHNDVFARVPPTVGWSSTLDDSVLNQNLEKWVHVTPMRYLTGDETPEQELWTEHDKAHDADFAAHPVPQYTAQMPLESWKQWAGDHDIDLYTRRIERLAFDASAACP